MWRLTAPLTIGTGTTMTITAIGQPSNEGYVELYGDERRDDRGRVNADHYGDRRHG